jgi:hypothetical protein
MFSINILYIFLRIFASRSIKKKFSIHKFFYRHPPDGDFLSFGNTFFAMDLEMHQHSINIAGTAAWIITDFLICSDAGNGFQIDGNKNFMVMKTFVHVKCMKMQELIWIKQTTNIHNTSIVQLFTILNT